MPHDKPKTADKEYAKRILEKYAEDMLKLISPHQEVCYRVRIAMREIKELTAKYHERIDDGLI